MILDQTVQAGQTATLDVSAYSTDADGDALTYVASFSNPSVAVASTSGAMVVITAVAKGSVTVTVADDAVQVHPGPPSSPPTAPVLPHLDERLLRHIPCELQVTQLTGGIADESRPAQVHQPSQGRLRSVPDGGHERRGVRRRGTGAGSASVARIRRYGMRGGDATGRRAPDLSLLTDSVLPARFCYDLRVSATNIVPVWLRFPGFLTMSGSRNRAGRHRMETRRRIHQESRVGRIATLLFAALLCTSAGACMQAGDGPPADDQPFDILLTNARVVDGAGNPWFRADVGVRGDRVAAVGRLAGREAARTIDGGDRVVTPGFVDMMGQASLVLITDPPSAESKLRQGITTYLSGEGGSPAPQSAETQQNPPVIDGDTLRWRRYSEYFAILESYGIPINVVHDVGLTQVRRVVLGVEDVAPTPEQMEQMRALVREGMEDGAVGVSTSLIYPPAIYASTDELVALASVAGEFGGVYFTHMRNESHGVLEAIREAVTIGEDAGVPVHIYHLKAAGQRNWPLMDAALALIDSVRTAGMDVTADIYPYVRNGIGLGSFLHPRHYARGTDAFLATLSDPELRARLKNEVEDRFRVGELVPACGHGLEQRPHRGGFGRRRFRYHQPLHRRSGGGARDRSLERFLRPSRGRGREREPAEHERGAEVGRAPGVLRDDRHRRVAGESRHQRQLPSARLRRLSAGDRQIRARRRGDHTGGSGAPHDLARDPQARPLRPRHRGAWDGRRPGGVRPGPTARRGRFRRRDALRRGGGLSVRQRHARDRRRRTHGRAAGEAAEAGELIPTAATPPRPEGRG